MILDLGELHAPHGISEHMLEGGVVPLYKLRVDVATIADKLRSIADVIFSKAHEEHFVSPQMTFNDNVYSNESGFVSLAVDMKQSAFVKGFLQQCIGRDVRARLKVGVTLYVKGAKAQLLWKAMGVSVTSAFSYVGGSDSGSQHKDIEHNALVLAYSNLYRRAAESGAVDMSYHAPPATFGARAPNPFYNAHS